MNKRTIATACGTLIVLGAGLAAPQTASAAAPAKYRTHSAAAKVLKAAGISWTSSGHCSNRNNSHCTSFTLINKTTVSGVIAFKKASKCAVTITGGTETGHASGKYSHWNGYKVDVNPTMCVSWYITKKFKYVGHRAGDGAKMYKSPAGNIYARESSHWDVLYYNGNR